MTAVERTFVGLPGDHYFREPPRAREELADLIADWVGARGAELA
jgi:hypothetical protein